MNLVGRTIGSYQIIEEIGRGGMAIVYKARQPSLNRYVALKVLPPQLAFDPTFVERFHREAKAAAGLSHPHIVTIYDIGTQDDLHYIVMEYLEGRTLKQVVQQGGLLPPAQVVHIVAQIANALDHAHRHGFIHRDVKPDNIFLDRDGQVTLTDFGIVKAASGTRLTATGMVIGTPEYMAPEQVEGTRIDHRTDIYSLGVVVYNLLSGQVPFRGATPQAVLYGHVHKQPPLLRELNPAVSDSVEAVVQRALAKDPAQRFQQAGALAAALQQAVRAESVSVSAEPSRRPGRKWLWAVAGAAAVFLLGILIWAVARPSVPAVTPVTTATATTVAIFTSLPVVTATDVAFASPTAKVSSNTPPIQTATSPPPPPPSPIPASPTPLPATPIVQGSQLLQLSNHPAREYVPSYAPDGRQIVYMSDQDGTWQIYLMNADGTAARRLTTNEADNYHPRFSPDGQQIVFASQMDGDWDIYLMDLDGRIIRQVTDEPGDQYYPHFAPDGQMLSLMGEVGGQWDVLLTDLTGSYLRNATDHPAQDNYAAFAPDGRHLVFQSDRDGNWELYRLDLDSGVVQRLTNDPGRDADPVVSPDGQWIAFESNRSGNHDIYAINWNGGQVQPVTSGPANDYVPSFAPDGSGIVFQSDRNGGSDIYVAPFSP